MPSLFPASVPGHKKIGQKSSALANISHYLQIAENFNADADTAKLERSQALQNACELLSVLLIQDDQDAELWLTRARVQQLQGNFSSALSDARHAIRLQPENTTALSLFVKLALQAHAGDIFSSDTSL